MGYFFGLVLACDFDAATGFDFGFTLAAGSATGVIALGAIDAGAVFTALGLGGAGVGAASNLPCCSITPISLFRSSMASRSRSLT